MEQVKSMTDELRGQRWTSILLGYVLVLAIMFVAFEYTQREIEKVEQEKIYESITLEEEMIPITTQKVELAPPPPAPKTGTVRRGGSPRRIFRRRGFWE